MRCDVRHEGGKARFKMQNLISQFGNPSFPIDSAIRKDGCRETESCAGASNPTAGEAQNCLEARPMRIEFPKASVFAKPYAAFLAVAFAVCASNAGSQNTQSQSQAQPSTQSAPASQPATTQQPHQTSPGGEVGHGAGDIGKGTAKGAGAAAKGVGKGAADLVTLHPISAAGAVAKGGAVAGKDVGVGAAKGTGKIAKGTGRGIGKLFHHHHDQQAASDSDEPQR
jgi:hypothetical protein